MLTTMIEISETAARKIRTLMAKQGISEGGLRVGVKGGGCSGLSYTFAWDKQPRLGDETARPGVATVAPHADAGISAERGKGLWVQPRASLARRAPSGAAAPDHRSRPGG